MIDLTGVDLVKLVKQAYALSIPAGLGILHYTPDVLSDADAQALIDRSQSSWCAVSLDYVKGRAVKLTVRRNGDRLELDDAWYDHTTEKLAALLESVGKSAPPAAEHNVSCECSACQAKRKTTALRTTTDAPRGGQR